MSRYARRTDANNAAIVQALRQVVEHVFEVRVAQPAGCPDLFVWSPRFQRWVGQELKADKGKLSPEQQRLVDLGAVQVVRTPEQALRAIGALG